LRIHVHAYFNDQFPAEGYSIVACARWCDNEG